MGLRERHRRWMQSWLERRLPPWRSLTLNQKRIFIFPSRLGLAAIGLLCLCIVLAINYQNNLVFGFSFWCLGILVVSILHSYAQLSGLRLQVRAPRAVFAGERMLLPLTLIAGNRDRHAIAIGWPDGDWQQWDIAKHQQQTVQLSFPTRVRGALKPPRIRVESRFPLGLICAWTWLAPDWQALVYPKPVPIRPFPDTPSGENDGAGGRTMASDEFYGFHAYQPGESLSRAYWRSYAKGQALLVVDYQSHLSQTPVLSWRALEGLPTESRLSALCARVLELEQAGVAYCVEFPALELSAGCGDRRLTEILVYLAEYR